MDRTLLEQKKPAGDQPAVLEHGSTTNNDAEDVIVETDFRDLEIEKRKPPVRVRFNPPIVFEGKTYTELTFDFDSMTGKDFVRAERTFQRLYKADKNEMPMPELKHLYHDLILAHLADVSYVMIQSLERRYYVPLRTEALKACGSSPEEKAE
jgi:hypothetical protein